MRRREVNEAERGSQLAVLRQVLRQALRLALCGAGGAVRGGRRILDVDDKARPTRVSSRHADPRPAIVLPC